MSSSAAAPSTSTPEMRFFADTRPAGGPDSPLRVRAFGRPYELFHDRYQRYYTEGLRRYCAETGCDFRSTAMSRFPRVLEILKRVREEGYAKRLGVPRVESFVDALAHVLEGPMDTPSGHFHDVTGQYLALLPGGELRRFAIDAQDSHEVGSKDLVAWSDVYFKTNYWPGAGYASNVVPLANADPFILPKIGAMRSSRDSVKRVDLSFIVRVWGGADEVEGIEHTLRLLEAVDRARCTTRILAIVVAGDVPQIRRRLDRARIPSTTRMIGATDLWRLTAESRLNVFRLGLRYCVPWRMTGSLAIGSCAVLDRPPFSVWPEPLREGVNFLSLGTAVGPGCPVAPAEQYDEIPARIEAWLAQPELTSEIARANAEYFDAYVEPVQLGKHVLTSITSGRPGSG
jgi:hypothetical protein